MKKKSIEFERKRGIVWVCDMKNSSKLLNQDETVDATEEFLPRLFWIGREITEAAGGDFVKWIGDGFLSWFECPLERHKGKVTSKVYNAAWHMSFTCNVTKLAVQTEAPFVIRHGITWEPDALMMSLGREDGPSTNDILGRAVVLAFRLSGIRVDFPGIVTEKSLVESVRKLSSVVHHFEKMKFSDEDILKYFKGERQNTSRIMGSSQARKSQRTRSKNFPRRIELAIDHTANAKPQQDGYDEFVKDYVSRLKMGPIWAQNTLSAEAKFIREDMVKAIRDVTVFLATILKSKFGETEDLFTETGEPDVRKLKDLISRLEEQ